MKQQAELAASASVTNNAGLIEQANAAVVSLLKLLTLLLDAQAIAPPAGFTASPSASPPGDASAFTHETLGRLAEELEALLLDLSLHHPDATTQQLAAALRTALLTHAVVRPGGPLGPHEQNEQTDTTRSTKSTEPAAAASDAELLERLLREMRDPQV